ncbi:MAG: acyl--CoA ligase [Rhodobacteraceae bacterium]|nr:acyl--CoA ligase [Paracoccaceae bacterium]
MRSVFDAGPQPPCPRPFNLAAHVLGRADADPEKPALVILGPGGAAEWGYGRLADTVRRSAGGLRGRGLAPGDRVLLRIGNRVEFPLAFLAAIAAGLVPVPTSAQLTEPEITAIAAEIAPRLIVAEPGVALPRTPSCPVLDLAAFDALAAADPLDPELGDPDRLAYIIYTSGTSGTPRAVMHAHRAIWARQMMMDGWYGLKPTDRLLHAGAFNWTFTLGTGLLDPWTRGATALIPAPGTAPADLPPLLAAQDVTIFAGAPGVYRQMLRSTLPPLPKLRHGLSAGEKMSPEVHAAWRAATGTPVFEAFGMSECSTFLSGAPGHPAPVEALGFPQPGRRVAILGEDGQPVPRGAPGIIAIAASDPGLMLGYLGQPEETRARYSADGAWFLTGDLGAMGPDDAVTYLGRGDDMMNAGGYRVSPVEVEAAMLAHPAITEAAAVEHRVPSGAQVIALHYVAAQPIPEPELADFAAARLARYKCPRIFRFETALPRGANNKLSRRALREREESHGAA